MRDIILSIFVVIAGIIFLVFVILEISGNVVTDQQKEFLHQASEMKRECELVLPRTEHCVIQFVPAH